MDSKGTAKADGRYNSNGDLFLTKTSAGVYNDGPWYTHVQEVLLVSFDKIKAAFDLNLDLAPYPDINPDAWKYPPVVADATSVPPIAAYPGRRRYPLGADGYPTEAADRDVKAAIVPLNN